MAVPARCRGKGLGEGTVGETEPSQGRFPPVMGTAAPWQCPWDPWAVTRGSGAAGASAGGLCPEPEPAAAAGRGKPPPPRLPSPSFRWASGFCPGDGGLRSRGCPWGPWRDQPPAGMAAVPMGGVAVLAGGWQSPGMGRTGPRGHGWGGGCGLRSGGGRWREGSGGGFWDRGSELGQVGVQEGGALRRQTRAEGALGGSWGQTGCGAAGALTGSTGAPRPPPTPSCRALGWRFFYFCTEIFISQASAGRERAGAPVAARQTDLGHPQGTLSPGQLGARVSPWQGSAW